ncbi:hypothetical protein OHB41_07840 [Streptomyces sp. NBC_01571]|uniref:hypothetical protein n=1 Tax=Streptomyces sp. NBC_01571 TaxID=2975883 RepID=UPI002251D7B5|nr:hypothetical protein [Streptomyces sp. NBC_01571]MCX4573097.1 hypothetical protein [Streptomyces sp. NBC_01571]
MKFKEEIRKRLVDHTVEGVTHQVERPYSVRTPILPADWDARAIKAASGLVLALTVVAIVWSTVSIGSLLHGGAGYAAAVVFDISWLTVLILEWLGRFDPNKRAFARNMGFVLVALTAGAIFWHGMLLGSTALAVVGAAVSVVAKALWLAIFKHVEKPLSEDDRQWVQAEISKANAKLAVAGVRRQAAAAEVHARLQLLAAEQALGEIGELTANTAEQPALDVIQGVEIPPLARPNTVRKDVEPVANISELARQQLTAGASKTEAFDAILRLVPEAKTESVKATIRREAGRLDDRQSGPYL